MSRQLINLLPNRGFSIVVPLVALKTTRRKRAHPPFATPCMPPVSLGHIVGPATYFVAVIDVEPLQPVNATTPGAQLRNNGDGTITLSGILPDAMSSSQLEVWCGAADAGQIVVRFVPSRVAGALTERWLRSCLDSRKGSGQRVLGRRLLR